MKQGLGRVFFTERSINRRTLGHISMIVFVAMLLPMVLIALYNYPADDDFRSVLSVSEAWVQTHDLGAMARAIFEYGRSMYMNWQGDWFSTMLFSLTPMVFGIDLYFLSNWFLLAIICLSTAYLVQYFVRDVFGAERGTFWSVYTPVMVLVLQFMPCIGEGIYWWNGGTYLMVYCVLVQALGLLGRCLLPQSHARLVWRSVLLSLCGLMLGGSFYGPMLGALVLVALLTVRAFVCKCKNRVQYAILLAAFAASFAFSAMAPGVAIRQSGLGEPMNPVKAVLTAVLDSFDTFGGWLSPQLLGMLLLILAAFWQPLKRSRCEFTHPFGCFVMLYGLFSAALVPGIYAMGTYDIGRYMNVLYLYFLMAAIGSAVYAEGWLIRRLEKRRESESAQHVLAAAQSLGERYTALFLAMCIALLTFGGFGFTIMNTASVCAVKSIVTGEAASFRREMKEREAYLLTADLDATGSEDDNGVEVLSAQPYIFKADKLPFQGIYGRVRYMQWYFKLFYNAEHPEAQSPQTPSNP